MFVYFIRTRAKPPMVKIGKARDITKRISELQTGSPYELVLLGALKCLSEMHARGIEKKLHLMLRHSRKRGEWFHLTPQVEFVLTRLAGSPCDRVTETVIEAWDAYRLQYRAERRDRRQGVRETPEGSTAPRSSGSARDARAADLAECS